MTTLAMVSLVTVSLVMVTLVTVTLVIRVSMEQILVSVQERLHANQGHGASAPPLHA